MFIKHLLWTRHSSFTFINSLKPHKCCKVDTTVFHIHFKGEENQGKQELSDLSSPVT